MAPNICWGDLALESSGTRSGYSILAKRTHPGQQEVKRGKRSAGASFSIWTNSLPSSMMVRSAEKSVSKT